MQNKESTARARVFVFPKNAKEDSGDVCAALADYGLAPEYEDAGDSLYLTIPASEMDFLLFLRRMVPKKFNVHVL
jgi:hypothetical protein